MILLRAGDGALAESILRKVLESTERSQAAARGTWALISLADTPRRVTVDPSATRVTGDRHHGTGRPTRVTRPAPHLASGDLLRQGGMRLVGRSACASSPG
jgi:hypothetical protein